MLTEKNFIEEFYNNRIQVGENFQYTSSEYADCDKAATNEMIKKLEKILGKDNQDLLSQLLDAQNELAGAAAVGQFVEGWVLGAWMVLDTFLIPLRNALQE